MDLDVKFHIDRNEATLGEAKLVFHCHHYNATLQKTIEEGLGADAADLLASAAQQAARQQLDAIGGKGPPLLEAGAELFRRGGFGTLDLRGLSSAGGKVVCPSSHYALGWLAKFGTRPTAACGMVAGYVAGMTCAAYDHAPERVRVVETECQAKGDARCTFTVEVL